MAQDYIPPKYRSSGFNCPHCGAFAHQQWRLKIDACERPDGLGEESRLPRISASICVRCGNFALWEGEQLFYPSMYVAPLPATDMPENAKEDYGLWLNISMGVGYLVIACIVLAIIFVIYKLITEGLNLGGIR